jgi:hypothetical protein
LAYRLFQKSASPTRYNNTVAILRHVLNVAAEIGVIYSNPAIIVKRAAVRGKHIALPRQGVVANTLRLFLRGAVGFIVWLDGSRCDKIDKAALFSPTISATIAAYVAA